MHHHRLVLNGPPDAVARLSAALREVGAVAVPETAAAPARLLWATPAPLVLETLCERHPAVLVGVERFAALGDGLARLVLQGPEATVLGRRALTEEPGPPGGVLAGFCLSGDCAPLDRDALRAAAHRVAALPADLGPGLAGSSLDDALLLGAAVGRVCVQATSPDATAPSHPLADDPRAAATPAPTVLDAISALAAAALTASAACSGPACPAELDHERAWRLTEATALACAERLWSRPGDADWPEWLMHLLAGAAAVVEDCAVCLHQPPPPFLSIHAEHFTTDEERLEHGAVRLVATCLQALVLFDAGPFSDREAGGCARN